MSFLKAEWRKLAIFNYEVDPNLLNPYLPFGTELDLWEDKCYVSVIGFMFMNTRLLGVPIPFHTNFEEVNLRFYVKRKVQQTWRRGVVFIKEIVPKPAITWVAKTIYNEKYETWPMRHEWLQKDNLLEVTYDWKMKSVWQSVKIKAVKEPIPIPKGSEAEFITEQYWGYARVTPFKTHEYEVTHPRWLQYQVQDFEISVDFRLNYGPTFGFLNTQKPASYMLAEGSEITIENKVLIS